MAKRDLVFRIGGAAGDGVSSTAESFAKISARSGLHTWTYSSYQSVIRGGHVWTQIRGGLDPVLSHGVDPDVVVALNQQTMDVHQGQVTEGGAIAAGVKFLAQYPMTPASSILHWMASHGPPHGVVVKQVEDELAAMNMAVGAGFAGVRAMTATSGGGFSLMVEAIGQAGMTETPLVAILVQRSGPSTGLPTRTEQGDLNLALGAGQGDWPRAILAPRNPEECFRLTAQAFNLAEVYQTPIIVISDLYLGEGYRTVEKPDFNVPIVRGMSAANGAEVKDFKRYLHTESGVSPRAIPGMKGYQFVGATDEHMENGELISDVLAGIPEYVAETGYKPDHFFGKYDGEPFTWRDIADKILEAVA